MAERDGLENRYIRKDIVGSNPTLSEWCPPRVDNIRRGEKQLLVLRWDEKGASRTRASRNLYPVEHEVLLRGLPLRHDKWPYLM